MGVGNNMGTLQGFTFFSAQIFFGCPCSIDCGGVDEIEASDIFFVLKFMLQRDILSVVVPVRNRTTVEIKWRLNKLKARDLVSFPLN